MLISNMIAKFRETIEKDQALNYCFQKITVNEPSVELSAKLLQGIKKKYESHHGIKISEEAVNYSAKLADRYISDKCLPDSAIDLLDEAKEMHEKGCGFIVNNASEINGIIKYHLSSKNRDNLGELYLEKIVNQSNLTASVKCFKLH